jgi:hypothetical protein
LRCSSIKRGIIMCVVSRIFSRKVPIAVCSICCSSLKRGILVGSQSDSVGLMFCTPVSSVSIYVLLCFEKEKKDLLVKTIRGEVTGRMLKGSQRFIMRS